MRKITSLVCVVVFIIYCFTAKVVLAEGNNTDNTCDAKNTIDKFCNSEFMGIKDARTTLAKFSPQYKARLRNERPGNQFYGSLLYLGGDSLIIVDSYKIIKVDIFNNNRVIATVDYKRLAKTSGDGYEKRVIIPDYIEHDIVKYEIEKTENQWRIIDPPLPRISQKAMIEYYEEELKSVEEIMSEEYWLKNDDTIELQKYNYKNRKAILEFIKSISQKDETK